MKEEFFNKEEVSVYVDGSYNCYKKIGTWGFLVVNGKNEVIHKEKGKLTDPVILEGWQVGVELEAVIQAVRFCKQNNLVCNIYYDLLNIYYWVRDLFCNEKPWKRKKIYTQNYRRFIEENRETIKSFIWVKGHSGNFYNEMIDGYLKSSISDDQITLTTAANCPF